ncbi:hypothetical protein Taro_037118 [Colocasia esculenta]|uniref:Growth-regulating factor n=1 Tax=Colocasia esculenta TaxID=4460 RepID=A0A843WNQ9_COLES|nr:hypothetical protein [Colocasia esculenta]
MNTTAAAAAAGCRPPFTASQWQELEHQALIFKYLMAGIPVPPDLLLPIRKSLESMAARFYHHPTSILDLLFFFHCVNTVLFTHHYHVFRYLRGVKSEVDAHSFFGEASGSARGLGNDFSLDSTWRLMPSQASYTLPKPGNSSLLQGNYPQLQPVLDFGHGTISSLSKQQQQQQQQHCFFGSDFDSTEPVKHESQPLRPFFDEWPKTRDSWSELEDDRSNRTSFSTTQLSISIPMASSDFSTTSSRSPNVQLVLCVELIRRLWEQPARTFTEVPSLITCVGSAVIVGFPVWFASMTLFFILNGDCPIATFIVPSVKAVDCSTSLSVFIHCTSSIQTFAAACGDYGMPAKLWNGGLPVSILDFIVRLRNVFMTVVAGLLGGNGKLCRKLRGTSHRCAQE